MSLNSNSQVEIEDYRVINKNGKANTRHSIQQPGPGPWPMYRSVADGPDRVQSGMASSMVSGSSPDLTEQERVNEDNRQTSLASYEGNSSPRRLQDLADPNSQYDAAPEAGGAATISNNNDNIMSQTTILEGGNLGSFDLPYQIASYGIHSN